MVAVVAPRPGEEWVIRRAADVAECHNAPLTVICLWSPSPLWRFTALAGLDPQEALWGTATDAAAWLRAACRTVPATISLTTCCRRRHGRLRGLIKLVSSRLPNAAALEVDPRTHLVEHAQRRLELVTVETFRDAVRPH